MGYHAGQKITTNKQAWTVHVTEEGRDQSYFSGSTGKARLPSSYLHHPMPDGWAGHLYCKIQRKNHEHTDLKDVVWNLVVEAAIYPHIS